MPSAARAGDASAGARSVERDVHACPDPELLASWLEGRASQAERLILQEHVAVCSLCHTSVAVAQDASQTSRVDQAMSVSEGADTADGPALDSAALDSVVLDGTYRLLHQVGKGGMGEVYAAEHLRLGQRVAIKRLKPDVQRHPAAVARFVREATVCARSNHPNIIRVFDIKTDHRGTPFFVMELLEGEDLAQRIAFDGALEPAEAIPLLVELCDALAWAHDEGIIHRDLKPSNIFLARRGQERSIVKVLDFGMSRVRSSFEASLTKSAEILGTPTYLSPEMAHGNHEKVDARSDLFSLGTVAYEMLIGRPPFSADSLPATVYQIVHTTPLPPHKLNTHVPKALSNIVMKLLCKDPANRYTSAHDVQEALEHLSVGTERRTSTHGTRLTLLASLILLCLGFAGWWWSHERALLRAGPSRVPPPQSAPRGPRASKMPEKLDHASGPKATRPNPVPAAGVPSRTEAAAPTPIAPLGNPVAPPGNPVAPSSNPVAPPGNSASALKGEGAEEEQTPEKKPRVRLLRRRKSERRPAAQPADAEVGTQADPAKDNLEDTDPIL